MHRQGKQNNVVHQKFCGGKIVSPHEMLSLLKKNQHNRMWILKQLSQLGIDTSLLEDYTLNDLYRHCDQIIKSTYSIKYLGMNQNEMGIISRRIDPFKDNNFNLNSLPQSTYTVNKFFFPKPLKVGRKVKKQEQINTDNLETEIKKAFLKNNPSGCHQKKAMRTSTIAGSWLSAFNKKTKDKQRQQNGSESIHNTHEAQKQKVKLKSHSQSKHLSSVDHIPASLSNIGSLRKMASSYSRFLSSGLAFAPAQSTQLNC